MGGVFATFGSKLVAWCVALFPQAHCAACCFDVLLVLTGSLYDVLPVLVGCVPYGVMFRLVAIFGREYVKFVVRRVVSVCFTPKPEACVPVTLPVLTREDCESA